MKKKKELKKFQQSIVEKKDFLLVILKMTDEKLHRAKTKNIQWDINLYTKMVKGITIQLNNIAKIEKQLSNINLHN